MMTIPRSFFIGVLMSTQLLFALHVDAQKTEPPTLQENPLWTYLTLTDSLPEGVTSDDVMHFFVDDSVPLNQEPSLQKTEEHRIIVRLKEATHSEEEVFDDTQPHSQWEGFADFSETFDVAEVEVVAGERKTVESEGEFLIQEKQEARAPEGGVERGEEIRNALERTIVLELDTNESVDEVLKELRTDPDVLWAEPEKEFQLQFIPNDPEYASQHFIHQNINSEAAWDISKGAGVVVAILDSGAEITHPDLAPNLWVNPGEVPSNGIDDDGNGYIDDVHGWNFYSDTNNLNDTSGHGTLVAGIVGGKGNNGTGISGVAPDVTLMILKGFNESEASTDVSLAEAIIYATDKGADVINCSFNGSAESLLLQDAISYAHSHGVVIVASAGNGAVNATSTTPANLEETIVVGATVANSVVAWFSNFGPRLELTANGVAYSTYTGGSYNYGVGTSFSTPQVSGVVALALARYPTYTNEQIRALLVKTATDLGDPGFDGGYGYGAVNAYRVVATTTVPLEVHLVTPRSNLNATSAVAIVGTVRAVGSSSPLSSWKLEVGSGVSPSSWDVLQSGVSNVINQTLTVYDAARAPEGTITFRLLATDTLGNTFESRSSMTVDFSVITSPVRPTKFSVAEVYKPGYVIPIRGSTAQGGGSNTTVTWGEGANPVVWSGLGISNANPATPYVDTLLGQWNTASLASSTAGYYTIRAVVDYGSYSREMRTLVYLEPDLISSHWPQSFEQSMTFALGVLPSKNSSGTTEVILSAPASSGFLGHGTDTPAVLYRYSGTGVSSSTFPINTGFLKQPGVGNLDQNVGDEIVVPDDTMLRVIRSDHSSFTVSLNPSPQNFLKASSILMSDLDNDGALEILVADNNNEFGGGYLYGISVNVERGTSTQLFTIPISQGNGNFYRFPASQILAIDLNGDGNREIIFYDSGATPGNTEYVLKAYTNSGIPYGGWSTSTYGGIRGLSGGDLNGDGIPEIVFASLPIGRNQNSQTGWSLRVLDTTGRVKDGWPVSLNFNSIKSINLGDLNVDGSVEIVVTYHTHISVYRANGTSFGGGWPLAAEYQHWFLPSVLADVDGDIYPEIITVDASMPQVDFHTAPFDFPFSGSYHYDNKIRVYKNNTSLHKSWASLGTKGRQAPNQMLTVGDFNDDAQTDIAVLSQTETQISDGFSLSQGGSIAILQTGGLYNASHNPWPMHTRDPKNTSLVNDVGFLDVTPPSAPGIPVASSITGTSLTLQWTPSFDAFGVAGYRVFQNGIVIATTSMATYVVSGLSTSTTYQFFIKAFDEARNISSSSPVLSVTTLSSADVTPPTAPGQPVASSITPRTVVLTWPVSVDDVGVVGYHVFRDNTLIATTGVNTYFVEGNSPNTVHVFRIVAFDAAINISSSSPELTVRMLPEAGGGGGNSGGNGGGGGNSGGGGGGNSGGNGGGGGNSGGGGGTKTKSTTPLAYPLNVSAYVASGVVRLTWSIPAGGEYIGTRVIRTVGKPAKDEKNGSLVYTGKGTAVADARLKNETTYVYALFGLNKGGKYSAPVFVTVTPSVKYAKEGITVKGILATSTSSTAPKSSKGGKGKTTLEPIPTRNLKLGNVHADVVLLQKFLNKRNFLVATTGPGSLGKETRKFDEQTKRALIRFQEKYASEILTPRKLKKGTGILDAETRKVMERLREKVATNTHTETATNTPTTSITRTLKMGDKGRDVRLLQELLNKKGFQIAATGPGSLGKETTEFTEAVKKSVIRFQEFYANDILVPQKLKKGTGIVDSYTRTMLFK